MHKSSRRFPFALRIGQILSVLIVILWVLSIDRVMLYIGDYYLFQATSGAFNCLWDFDNRVVNEFPHSQRGFSVHPRTPRRFGLTLPKSGTVEPSSYLYIPLWMPLFVIAIPTTILWYRHRNRLIPGHCQKCRYNLTGNESGICPECGTKIQQ